MSEKAQEMFEWLDRRFGNECGHNHARDNDKPPLPQGARPDTYKYLDAELSAAEERGRRRGVEERDKLRETLKELFALVEEGLLVRNIGNDGDPGWTINAMRIVLALKHAKDALAPRDSGKVPGSINVAELFDPAGDEE